MKAKEVFMYALGALITIGFFLTLIFVLTKEIPEQNMDTANQTLGALLVAFAMVVGYFYGSSKGSSDKNEMLNKKQ